MLGRLATWLRLLGYDASYQTQIGDWTLVRRCAREGRILLTRDRGIVKRWQVGRGLVRALLLDGDQVEGQLRQVREAFSLVALSPRCPRDNSVLEDLPRGAARGRVPKYVFATQNEFHVCPRCRRVFWKATHWQRIEQVRMQAVRPSPPQR